MADWHQQFDVANAWESWWLGWIAPQEIIADGVYQIEDYVTTGDAIRIPIPNTNGEYLWIENHQKVDSYNFDDKPYYRPSSNCPGIEDIDPGLYMYITKHFGDRSDPSLMSGGSLDATNFIKLFNAEGNSDLLWDQLPDLSVPCPGSTPVFVKQADNPIAGQSTYNYVRYNNDSNSNEITVPNWHGNGGCSYSEGSSVAAELINGVRTPTMARTGKHGQAFIQGSEIGLSGKVPVTNYPVYDYSAEKLNPYILNGLSINVTNYDTATGTYTLDINFSDFEVRADKRWCGNIELPPNPNVSSPSLEIVSGVTLTVDESGTPNRRTEITPGSKKFIDPTVLTCMTNTYVKLQSNSNFVIDNGSTLVLKPDSKIDIQSGAILRVKRGGKLVLEGNATINVMNGGRIIIEDDGSFDYYEDAQLTLNGDNAVCDIRGMLNIMDDATFTFTSDSTDHGYIRLANTNTWPTLNLTAGANTKFILTGNYMHRRVLAIDQETFHAPASLMDFKITDGKIEFDSLSRIQSDGLNTNIEFTNVLFTSKTGGYNGHRGLHLYGQPDVQIEGCIFEYGKYGIFAFLTYGGAPLTISTSCFFNNDRGLWVNDKGFDIIQCFFWDNDYGIEADYMSFPSYTLDGTVGSPGGGNSTGIDFQGYNTASLFIEDPFIRGNHNGVTVSGVDLEARCGIVAFNTTGFDMKLASRLKMNDGAAVTAVANDTTIKATYAADLLLVDGFNDLTPVEQEAQKCINGDLWVTTGQVSADNNKWNDGGTFSTSDYSLNIPITDNSPLSTITSCGQAINICTASPCDQEMVEVSDPEFVSFMEGEFTGSIWKENVIDRIAEINNTESPFYPDIISSFSEALLGYTDNNIGEEDRADLDRQYREMMVALGHAFRLGQLTAEENYPDLSDTILQIIEIQDSIFQFHASVDNRKQALSAGLDRAQTCRLASRRDLARIALEDLTEYAIGEEESNIISEFDCRISIEQDLLENELSIIYADLPSLIAACSVSILRKGKSQAKKESRNDLNFMIMPNPATSNLTVKSNLEIFRFNIHDLLGQKIYSQVVNFNADIDVSSYTKGLYIITIEKNGIIIESRNVSIQ